MLRSATTRLILVHLLLLAALTGLVLGSLYWRVGGVIDAEQRAVVEAEMRGFTDDYARGGIPALAVAIDRRLATPPDRDAVYLLADPTGGRIAGNLARWPPTVAPDAGWATLRLYRTDRRDATEISALALRLPGGELLLVGRDVAARAAFDRALSRVAALGARGDHPARARHRLAAGAADPPAGSPRSTAPPGRSWAAPSTAAWRCAAPATSSTASRAPSTPCSTGSRRWCSDLRMVTDSLAHDLRGPLGRLVRDLEVGRRRD